MRELSIVESVEHVRPADLCGVEAMRATYVTHRFSRHFHSRYAIGVIERGALRFRYLGGDCVAAGGEVNIVEPGEVHDGHAALDEGWSYRMLYLSPEVLSEAAAEMRGGRREPVFGAGVLRDPALAGLVRRAHHLAFSPQASWLVREEALRMLLSAWIARHGREAGSLPEPRREPGAVARVRELITARYAEDLSLAELAAEAGMSRFALLRAFSRHLGLTPHAYLVQERLRRAKALLGTPLRLADVAAEAGFADQSHLTRLFKARYGVTPARYRGAMR